MWHQQTLLVLVHQHKVDLTDSLEVRGHLFLNMQGIEIMRERSLDSEHSLVLIRETLRSRDRVQYLQTTQRSTLAHMLASILENTLVRIPSSMRETL